MHGEDTLEKLRALIPKHDGEDLVVDNLFDVLGDSAEKRFTIENGSELPADVVEKLQGLGLVRVREEERLRRRSSRRKNRSGGEFGGFFHVRGTERPILT